MGKVTPFKRKAVPSQVNNQWFEGFNAGAKQQREADIQQLANMLNDLETIPGIGEKRSWQIRKHFMNRFGIKEE